jgi:hypothetical protein
MAALTVNRHIEKVERGQCCTGSHGRLPFRNERHVVQRKDFVAGEAFEQAVLDHRASTAEPFFRGLEDREHGAVEIAGAREMLGGGEQHDRVSVMAAAVEFAVDGRAPGRRTSLRHR